MSQSRDELSDFARRYTEAWCSGDPSRVADHYAPRGSLTINEGTPAIGRDAITEAAQGFMVGFPDLRVEMDEFRLDGASPAPLDADGDEHRAGWHGAISADQWT